MCLRCARGAVLRGGRDAASECAQRARPQHRPAQLPGRRRRASRGAAGTCAAPQRAFAPVGGFPKRRGLGGSHCLRGRCRCMHRWEQLCTAVCAHLLQCSQGRCRCMRSSWCGLWYQCMPQCVRKAEDTRRAGGVEKRETRGSMNRGKVMCLALRVLLFLPAVPFPGHLPGP